MDLKKRNCIVVIEQSSNTAVKCLKKKKNMGVPKIMPYCGCAATFFLHILLTRWFHFENRGKRTIFSHSLVLVKIISSFGIFFGKEVFTHVSAYCILWSELGK